ncbi:battenin CLN3 protein [Coniosporium tulheliwenetii]|nr:battenin CLN3 protein [Cladosporium sp. JES 115]
MLISFFVVLPRAPLKTAKGDYEAVAADEEHDDELEAEDEGLLAGSLHSTSGRSFSMLPLLLVYIAEYTINQGVAPTLLFPLDRSPFAAYRSFYPTYNAIYQLGVFLSRSSTPFFRIHDLYFPSFLQCLNLLLLTLHALFNFIPSVWIIFGIVFWEGLLGGLVYVNTFAEITDNVRSEDREFSLGATSVSDSGGVCVAGFLGMAFEVWLCDWQVAHGRDYCRRL